MLCARFWCTNIHKRQGTKTCTHAPHRQHSSIPAFSSAAVVIATASRAVLAAAVPTFPGAVAAVLRLHSSAALCKLSDGHLLLSLKVFLKVVEQEDLFGDDGMWVKPLRRKDASKAGMDCRRALSPACRACSAVRAYV